MPNPFVEEEKFPGHHHHQLSKVTYDKLSVVDVDEK
jgi:hypothetical protein